MEAKQNEQLFESRETYEPKEPNPFYLIFKRTADIVGALVGIIITIPIAMILWTFYQFGENKGPLFFRQKRIGKNGEVFNIYKFRSMIVNAEEKLKENKTLYKEYIKNNYKLEPDKDPRITKLGCILRKTSVDELPQFINVLKGEMSLVGPRPVVQEELIEYQPRIKDFLLVKPGVTGYWQICGRSDVGYPERADLELYYIDNQGWKLDLEILVKTVILVFTRKGAY